MRRLLAALLFLALPAGAQEWPDRPVQVIVSWTAGGVVDTIGRGVAAGLSEVLNGRFVVVNRDGGSGMVGAQALATARPDGSTIGFGPITPITAAPHTQRNVPYQLDSFDYVCKVFENVLTVMVPPSSRIEALTDLIAEIRRRPNEMSYGHFGTNSLGHLSFANMAQQLGLQLVDVPFRGEVPIYTEMAGGRLDFGIGTMGGSRGKEVRILAVFGDRRSPSRPDVPAVAEFNLPTLYPVLSGILVPRGTPAPIVARLEQGCAQAVQTSSFRELMARLQEPIVHQGRAEFTAAAQRDWRENGAVVDRLGLRPRAE